MFRAFGVCPLANFPKKVGSDSFMAFAHLALPSRRAVCGDAGIVVVLNERRTERVDNKSLYRMMAVGEELVNCRYNYCPSCGIPAKIRNVSRWASVSPFRDCPYAFSSAMYRSSDK
jgi:hypothetical protein